MSLAVGMSFRLLLSPYTVLKITMSLFVSRLPVIRMDFQEREMVNAPLAHLISNEEII